ncbi:MAG: type II toxin-antitoxin system HicA family toxin [Myxococcales bacterium]
MAKTSELLARLRRAGFVLERHGKRHDLYFQPQTGKRVVVWRHAKEIPTGTFYSILRDAGLGDEE